jgi:protein canopy 1/2
MFNCAIVICPFQIPLARSELHLTELLEQICNRMNNYGIAEDSSGKINYIRTSSRDQAAITFKTVKVSSETQSRLKFAVYFVYWSMAC